MAPSSPQTPSADPRRIWRLLALLGLLVACLCVYLSRPRPGRSILTYRIGHVDERFGLSREEVSEAVRTAESLWREAAGRYLFREDPRGDIEINLIYDARQETVDRLQALRQGIQRTQGSLDGMRASVEEDRAAYEGRRRDLEEEVAAHEARVRAFNARAEALRRDPGVSPAELRRLEGEREALRAAGDALDQRHRDLEESRQALNASVATVNQNLEGQRAQVTAYQEAGNQLPGEYDGGEYVRRAGRQTINIYSFASRKFLVRVLAHELGHALQLEHGRDPRAVMYPQILTDAWDLAPEDIAAVQARTGRKP